MSSNNFYIPLSAGREVSDSDLFAVLYCRQQIIAIQDGFFTSKKKKEKMVYKNFCTFYITSDMVN